MERILSEGRNQEIGTFGLWGAESPIYRNRGFSFGGHQIRVSLSALTFPKSTIEGFEFRSGWDAAIGSLLLTRREGLLYADSDILWLSRHVNVEWRTLWFDGKCLAYCGWNRGIDLPNIIHELGGVDEGCALLLRLIRERYPNLEWITHPRLPSKYGITGTHTGIRETLAQFKIESGNLPRAEEIWFSGMDSC
jgi:hypothetical protein